MYRDEIDLLWNPSGEAVTQGNSSSKFANGSPAEQNPASINPIPPWRTSPEREKLTGRFSYNSSVDSAIVEGKRREKSSLWWFEMVVIFEEMGEREKDIVNMKI
ncbi:hypothetical protein E3N88_17963 [Mikania micrantha]|uniref:Uncharacterized protein n=1 Tax=Mikania micrantha TaxID=192012 RepID=A0A5N6NWE0_9ASTR|nr:hypothetical protein E3N88_17963 [Mikania micrantha]